MKSILVTGGCGYIGSVLCERLIEEGYWVTCVDNLMYGQSISPILCKSPNYKFINKDVMDLSPSEFVNYDVIIPLAAIVGARACDKKITLAKITNKASIIAVLRKKLNSQLLIYPNTNSGYGSSSEMICTEETPTKPLSLYARLKCEAEKEVMKYKNVIILRLATVFGVSYRMRRDLLVNDLVYKAYRDGYIVLYEKYFKRNFVHVSDVADCFIHCIENSGKMRGQIYNLGNDEANLTKEELAFKIRSHCPCDIITSKTGKDPDQRNYVVSSEKLAKAGFAAERTLDYGIEELLKYYSATKSPMENA